MTAFDLRGERTDLRMFAEEAARAVLPEASALPLYIVFANEIRPELRLPGADGWTGRSLASMCVDSIERRRAWRGDGPAIALDVAWILRDLRAARDLRRLERVLRRRILRARLVPLVVHECAHVAIDWLGPAGPPRHVSDAPWRFHGPRFIRVFFHLHRRAADLGIPCAGFRPRNYGLRSDLETYRETLQRELANGPARDIRDVIAAPPVPALDRLFRHDCRRWRPARATAGRAADRLPLAATTPQRT